MFECVKCGVGVVIVHGDCMKQWVVFFIAVEEYVWVIESSKWYWAWVFPGIGVCVDSCMEFDSSHNVHVSFPLLQVGGAFI